MYTWQSGKFMKLLALPSTELNIFLHTLCAYLQTILAKSADQQGPQELDITICAWEFKDGVPTPVMCKCCNSFKAQRDCESAYEDVAERGEVAQREYNLR